mmetsp:Transcript_31379/g.67467  ORF Transcript_31379/g.67467 Transcript_31379/m.67467 type:complete len:202 (+) Transcript_31379:928-1533(+)
MMTCSYHFGKLPSLVYSIPLESAPSILPTPFVSAAGAFGALAGLAPPPPPPAAAGAAQPKSRMIGSCLKWRTNLSRSADERVDVMSLRSGWQPITAASAVFLSSTSFTSQLGSFITASGVTDPCATLSLSCRTSSVAKRKFAAERLRSFENTFMSTFVSAATDIRYMPCFLSFTNKFLTNEHSTPLVASAARPASTVMATS